MNPEQRDTSERETLDLILRHAGGDATEAEAAELSRRLRESAEARELYNDVALAALAVSEQAAAGVSVGLPEAQAGNAAEVSVLRRWAAWWGPIAAAIAILLAGAGVVLKFGGESKIVQVAEISGAVRWTGAGGEIDESPSGALPGGTMETVTPDSSATLVFKDGSKVTLAGSSVVTFSDDGQKQVRVREGSISASVKPQKRDKPFLVRTPTALMNVLGTRFTVDSAKSATVLSVDEGAVRMMREVDGQIVNVPAGFQAVSSLRPADEFAPVRVSDPVSSWASRLDEGIQGNEGEWVPPADGAPARLRAVPIPIARPKEVQVPQYALSFFVGAPGKPPVIARDDSVLRVRGRLNEAGKVVVMLNMQQVRGGFAGNYFRLVYPPAGETWEMEIPLSEFERGPKTANASPLSGLKLRKVVLYMHTNAGLEVENVEIGHLKTSPTR